MNLEQISKVYKGATSERENERESPRFDQQKYICKCPDYVISPRETSEDDLRGVLSRACFEEEHCVPHLVWTASLVCSNL